MPQYLVQNSETKVVSELPLMTWKDFQKFLTENPTYTPVLTKPAFVKVN
jgi:hypothetical protein